MNRRTIVFIMIFLFTPAILFSAAQFWVLDSTDWIKTTQYTDYYRFNFQTVMNLDQQFLQPSYSSDDYGDTQYISSKNAIASVGVSGCEHKIIYTIEALHDGTFVSQSDPSKYRSYYVVASPDFTKYGASFDPDDPSTIHYNTTGSGTRYFPRSYYYYDEATGNYVSSTNADLPNTNNNSHSMQITTPKTDGTSSKVGQASNWGSGITNVSSVINAFGLDLFICMDALTESDYYHLIEADDYQATINIGWKCTNNCPEHSGNFTIVVRGYVEDNTMGTEDAVFLTVEPTVQSMSLDIKNMILSNVPTEKEIKIADFSVNTTTIRRDRNNPSNEKWKWFDRVSVFLSSSPDYNATGQQFLLWNIRNNLVTIPYTITVYNNSDQSKQTYSTFDGTDGYVSPSSGNYLDLRDLTKRSTDYYSVFKDRYQQNYYAINYSAEVTIKIDGSKTVLVNNEDIPISTILANPNTYRTRYASLVGNYQSYIYYHVVYSD